jgi:hypothetical protein
MKEMCKLIRNYKDSSTSSSELLYSIPLFNQYNEEIILGKFLSKSNYFNNLEDTKTSFMANNSTFF